MRPECFKQFSGSRANGSRICSALVRNCTAMSHNLHCKFATCIELNNITASCIMVWALATLHNTRTTDHLKIFCSPIYTYNQCSDGFLHYPLTRFRLYYRKEKETMDQAYMKISINYERCISSGGPLIGIPKII